MADLVSVQLRRPVLYCGHTHGPGPAKMPSGCVGSLRGMGLLIGEPQRSTASEPAVAEPEESKIDPAEDAGTDTPVSPAETEAHTNSESLPLSIFAEEDRAEGSDAPVLEDHVLRLLHGAGMQTVDDARAYLAEHGSFKPIRGIGKTTDREIREAIESLDAA